MLSWGDCGCHVSGRRGICFDHGRARSRRRSMPSLAPARQCGSSFRSPPAGDRQTCSRVFCKRRCSRNSSRPSSWRTAPGPAPISGPQRWRAPNPTAIRLLLTSSAFVVNPALYKRIPLRSRQGFCADRHASRSPPNVFRRQSGRWRRFADRLDWARQGQPADSELCEPRQRHHAAINDGALQAQGGGRDHQYTVQRRRTGDAGAHDRNGGRSIHLRCLARRGR